MIRSRTARATLALLAAAMLASCSTADPGTTNKPAASGNESGAPEDIRLAGVSSTASDPFYATIMCGATKEAKRQGATIDWKASNTLDTASAQANFQAATLLRPNGLVIATYEPGTFSNQIKSLMQKGTPVVSVDGPITPATDLQYISSETDNAEFAKLVGESVGSSGTIAILGGQQGAQWARDRWKPLEAVLPDGVKLLKPQFSDFDRNKAATTTSSLMLAHPDLKAVYAVSGPEGEGAAAAVQQAGKQGKVKVFAYDATPSEVAALKAGTIDALLAQAAETIGVEAVKTLVATIKEHEPGTAVEPMAEHDKYLPLRVLTKDNVGDPESAAYLYASTCG